MATVSSSAQVKSAPPGAVRVVVTSRLICRSRRGVNSRVVTSYSTINPAIIEASASDFPPFTSA